MDLHQVLSAYRTVDPAGWVAVYRLIPTWAGLLSIGVGIVLLLWGGGRAFRLVAGPMGAVVGGLWVPVLVERLGLRSAEATSGTVAAVLFLALGFTFPPGVVFFAFGLPAGILAGELAGSADWLLGFIPAFLLVGVVAAVLQRHIGAVAASTLGGWLLVIGMLAALHQVGSIVAQVASQPTVVMIAAALFAVAGAVYQLAVLPSPEEQAQLRVDRARKAQRQLEKKKLEQRWSNYKD